MTNRETMELFIEKNGQETVAYPFVEKDHVVFGNGMGIEEVIEQDISMPTVTHEEVSFKVGVGDQDVSSSIVDSSVGEMVIKGQTYQNILPEPSTHILTNDKEMFKVNEGLDSSVEIVDGVAKSAILKGQTLVNLVKHYNELITSSEWASEKITNVKPNTKYTFICEVKCSVNYTPSTGGFLRVEDWSNGKETIPCGITNAVNENYTTNKITFTTSDNVEYLIIRLRNANKYECGVKNLMIIEGDHTNADISYFNGMQSVKMPVLTTTGKNLLCSENSVFNASSDRIYRKIYLKPNTDYYMSAENEHFFVYRVMLCKNDGDVNKLPTELIQLNIGASRKFNSGNYSGEFFILFHAAELYTNYANNWVQVEEGSTPTAYEPFKSNILSTPSDLELRGIGEVRDTLDCLTGEVVERIGEYTITGEEPNLVLNTMGAYPMIEIILKGVKGNCRIMSNKIYESLSPIYSSNTVLGVDVVDNIIRIRTQEILDGQSLDEFKKTMLPLTVKYEIAQEVIKTVDLSIIDQDGNTPEGLHFFKDGHIIQSSGADRSLIPTLDYQAKTSNSYVMDLMKTNTKYTMKAKSASGTFTIDGTSYGAGTNETFTTPTLMTNKLLVMSNKTNEEVMIIEGDVVSKTIPYFKGIKSAFEGEDKIEVLSTGKNLFDGELYVFNNNNYVATPNYHLKPHITNLTSGNYTMIFTESSTDSNAIVYKNGVESRRIGIGRVINNFTLNAGENGISFYRKTTEDGNATTNTPVCLQKNSSNESYEPHKSNSTKIPLLSPLRSLPNGVCDELIIDRMKKKATLIQRVEAIPVTSVDDIRLQANLGRYNRFFIHKRQTTHPTFSVSSTGSQLSNWCPHHAGFTTDSYHFYVDGAGDIMLFDKSETLNSIRTKMSQSPFVALHQLATPIVTEVDLEGFPYIYKDGHIFLNSEIAPTTQITYSISQQHQISASTQDLIRHEQELVYLYKLIAQYIQVDYQSTLLSLDLKLK